MSLLCRKPGGMKFSRGLMFFLVYRGRTNLQKPRRQTFRGVSLAGPRRTLENDLRNYSQHFCRVIEQTV
jgi:hypothetical protein